MKISAFKIIKSWLNKTKPNKFLNKLNKLTKFSSKERIAVGISLFIFIFIFSYLIRPIYFDYDLKKNILRAKINDTFKVDTNINGKINYTIFPSPRIIVKNAKFNFEKISKDSIKIKTFHIAISPFKLKNIENFTLTKILVSEQRIELLPSNIKSIFKYFNLHKKKNIIFKNSQIVFLDQQGNEVNFKDFNLKDRFSDNKHELNGSVNFSNNKINLEFYNNFGFEKYLKINIPKLKQSLDINFDPESNLENLSGELKLKFFESILLLNFKGKDKFKISRSYLRNKFLNSKIDGEIYFKDEFNFNLNLDINQISLRKFLLSYYPVLQRGGLSKKINGKLNILIKNSSSLFGKIKNTKLDLIFENGDIRIANASSIFPENSKVESNMLISLNNSKPKVEFNIRFSSKDMKKYIRKFGVYDSDKNQTSVYANGVIDLNKNKIKFIKIIRNNNEKVGRDEIAAIENAFNRLVINEGILGVFDFFKYKKFLQETY